MRCPTARPAYRACAPIRASPPLTFASSSIGGRMQLPAVPAPANVRASRSPGVMRRRTQPMWTWPPASWSGGDVSPRIGQLEASRAIDPPAASRLAAGTRPPAPTSKQHEPRRPVGVADRPGRSDHGMREQNLGEQAPAAVVSGRVLAGLTPATVTAPRSRHDTEDRRASHSALTRQAARLPTTMPAAVTALSLS